MSEDIDYNRLMPAVFACAELMDERDAFSDVMCEAGGEENPEAQDIDAGIRFILVDFEEGEQQEIIRMVNELRGVA